MSQAPRDSAAFRELFPALGRTIWLDTAGSPPGCTPVVDSVRSALEDWESGAFDWQQWDATVEVARSAFARYVGVPKRRVAAVGSVTEAAASVAASIPPGRIVVSDAEYRSMLWPFTRLDPAVNEVLRVPAMEGLTTTDALIAAIDERTCLVSVSEVLSSNGSRLDLGRLKSACDRVGARLFVDVTQSLGALDPRIDRMDADYVVVHGYKWMLAPRGAAWMVVADRRIEEMTPVLSGWKSSDLPHGYFGGELRVPTSARRLDTSPAWFSWIGALAALEVLETIDRRDVETHVLETSGAFTRGAVERGFTVSAVEQPSHIAVVHAPADVDLDALSLAGVRAGVTGRRVRAAFHYFVSRDDVEAALDALDSAVSR